MSCTTKCRFSAPRRIRYDLFTTSWPKVRHCRQKHWSVVGRRRFFRLLAKESSIDLTVIYCSGAGAESYRDEDMKTTLRWDIDLLQGYHLGKPATERPWKVKRLAKSRLSNSDERRLYSSAVY